MRRGWSLRTVLPAIAALSVLAVAALVSNLAVGLLRRLADEQSLAAVRAAGLAALREIGQAGEDLDVSTRLLAERPTLRRLVEEGRGASRREFLERFATTAGLDGCAVIDGELEVAPWPEVAARAPDLVEGWSVLAGRDGGPASLVATRSMSGIPGVRVVCVRRLDARIADEVAEQVGMQVDIVEVASARAAAGDRLAELRGRAAVDGLDGAARIDRLEAFVDVRPLLGVDDDKVAVLETRAGTAPVDRSVRSLQRSLWVGAGLSAALAALAALFAARRLTAPLGELSRAAGRIGSGDLDNPPPRAGSREVGALSDAMDDMRSRLRALTSELRRRDAESSAILAGIVEGVWAVDRERRITWMNRQAAERLGIQAADAVGKFCGDVLHPGAPDGARPCEVSCPIVDARFRGSARATEHLSLPNGEKRTVVVTSAPTVAESEGGDRESRQFQVMRDETAEEGARRMRDAVLANVSHEFRTPLSAQLASLELLRERLEGRDDPDVADLVGSMERGTLRLVRLVDNLLESLRIDAGRDSIRRMPVDLGLVVDEAIEQVAPLARQKGQVLAAEIPGDLPEVLGDGPRLVQVFTNLLANASKFAPDGTTITVGGAGGGTEVTVWVQDRGPGFPEDPEDRRFERFSRAASGEPEERGIGLGLFIANSIVERHGGTLRARNTEPGARIAVTLPLMDGDESPGR